MELRTLSWAGVEARVGSTRLLIDPLQNTAALAEFLGTPRTRLVDVALDEDTWAAVTHLHRDHFDPQLLARLPSRHVLCHQPVAEDLAAAGVDAVGVSLWETASIGELSLTAVPSHDWRGEDQVAWVVDDGTHRVIHCGDTIWHGGWYEIVRRMGPIDVAFLPINGVVARLEGFTPTEVPATLTPEHAIEAAAILCAGTACAIHHGLFHNPPVYVEQDDAVQRFLTAATRRGMNAVAPTEGTLLGVGIRPSRL